MHLTTWLRKQLKLVLHLKNIFLLRIMNFGKRMLSGTVYTALDMVKVSATGLV